MDKIRNRLLKLKDEKYCKFNEKLCPDTKYKIIGIRVPILRKLALEILNDDKYDWIGFIKKEELEYFEEVMLQGFIIAYSKMEFKEKLNYIKLYVPKIDSWALTDSFIPTLKIKNNNLEEYWEFIKLYLNSNKEFEIRFAVVSMLDYFINDTYVDNVINLLDKISHDGYYVKMAVAWTIAEVGIKYNDKAMKYLNSETNLDKFTYNKTLQKMIESFRIEDSQKNILRKMKRK